jgi:hypothetical protein
MRAMNSKPRVGLIDGAGGSAYRDHQPDAPSVSSEYDPDQERYGWR